MIKSWLATGTSILCAAVLLVGCGYNAAGPNNAGTKGYGTKSYNGGYGGSATRPLSSTSYGASDTTTYGTPGLGGLTTPPSAGTAYTNRYGYSGYSGTMGTYGTSGFTGTGTYGRSGNMGIGNNYGGPTDYIGTNGVYGTNMQTRSTGMDGLSGHSQYGAGQQAGMINGVSSHLEKQLRQAGITGVKVLAIGDTIVLGEQPRQAPTRSTGPNTGTDLSKAVNQMKSLVGGGGRILTVSSPQAIQAMERVKSQLNSATDVKKNQTISKDFATIVNSAVPHTGGSR
ncbi:hypothetical protein ACQCN2_09160 [Brevibacillus ginsengisoli]|uniref:hypothetical protein n=1 Tax=Brevibacillus ginsengisoli TaxID=363854 RepID=UPI003CF720B5